MSNPLTTTLCHEKADPGLLNYVRADCSPKLSCPPPSSTQINTDQHSIPAPTNDAFAVGGPGAALDGYVFVSLCQQAPDVDRLPLVGRCHLEKLRTHRLNACNLKTSKVAHLILK